MPSKNPFRDIIPILRANKLFSIAYDGAMKASIRGTSEAVHPLRRSRKKEAVHIELLSKELRNRLFRIVEEFPRMEPEIVPNFYLETLDISFGVDRLRKTLGSLSGAANVIWRIKRKYIGDVWHAGSVVSIKSIRRAAFGRIRSVIMKLDNRLVFLETVRSRMRLMPGIDLDQPTLCIAGYPNVGKSSLVNTITSAKPEIGAYPFTTKEVTLGHLKIPIFINKTSDKPITHISCQIVDTPGILDRPLEKRNEIELRAIAALKNLSSGIVFIFDYTQTESLISQKNLFFQISRNFENIPFLILCSKEDLLDKNQKDEFYEFWEENFPQIQIHLVSMNDKEQLTRLLIDFFQENRDQIQQILNERKLYVIGEPE
jgi:nucleolar GTP-binding protein